ncbi:MAG TPA: hypothetical protein VF541_22285 [Longimicrobium sp.]|jgi:hypothetical protein
MKKLTLQLEALRVESFDTGADTRRSGTVRGHDTRETEWCYSTYAGCSVKYCPTLGCQLTPLCPDTGLCADTEAPVC